MTSLKPIIPILFLFFTCLVAMTARPGRMSAEENNTAEDHKIIEKLEDTLQAGSPHMKIVGQLHTAHLTKRTSTEIDIPLAAARCYKFAVAGGPGVEDLSLVLTVNGNEVGSDRLSGTLPTVKWCAPDKTEIKAKVSMYDGNGLFALAVFEENPAGTDDAGKVGGMSGDIVSNRIRQLHARFGKERAAFSPVMSGNLRGGETRRFPINLDGGRCYTVIAAATPSIRQLDIALDDAAKNRIAGETTTSGFSVFEPQPCPVAKGSYTITVTVVEGKGLFGVQIFSDK